MSWFGRGLLSAWCACALLLAPACDDDGPMPVDSGPGTGPQPDPRDAGHEDPPPPTDGGMDVDGSDDEDAGAGVDAPACGSGECDLFEPLACGDAQGCVLLIDDGSMEPRAQCTDVGLGLDGDACDSYLECGPGLDCTGAGGSCRRPCCALNQTAGCPAGQFCRVALTDGEDMATGVALCDLCDACDLRDTAGCGEGLGCYALPGGSACTACLAAGAAAVGEACDRANDCVAGAGCFAAGGEPRCVAFCTRDAEGACPGEARCREVAGIALPDAVGLCL